MPESPKSPVPIGREATFTKTVGESDVYLCAGITGDFESKTKEMDRRTD